MINHQKSFKNRFNARRTCDRHYITAFIIHGGIIAQINKVPMVGETRKIRNTNYLFLTEIERVVQIKRVGYIFQLDYVEAKRIILCFTTTALGHVSNKV